MVKQLSHLLRRMQQVLREPQPALPGSRQLVVSLSMDVALAEESEPSLLPWLATQPVYPQFYWQHRQEPEEAAVCGVVRGFRHIRDAEDFFQHYRSAPDVRVWGLNGFERTAGEEGESADYLFLPRVEVMRQGDRLSLKVNLFSEDSLQADADEAAAFIKFLLPAHPIAPLTSRIVAQEHQPSREGWVSMLEQALASIAADEMEKVVLARCTTLTLSQPLRPASMMAASRAANHRCFHFMLAHNAEQAFMGSSPERLYLRQGTTLNTEALAGTVASDDDDCTAETLAQWLMNDRKNQCENQFVVDDISQRLQQSTATLDVMPAEVIRLRKVQHLRRAIRATLHQASDTTCLNDLQPTAAVAGLPRQAARAFIRQVEPFTRGWYAGSAGYLSLAQAEFCVALRSAEINGDKINLYSGAGILPGSDPEQEWVELDNKAAGLKTLFDGEVS